jgi:hypothetical protein
MDFCGRNRTKKGREVNKVFEKILLTPSSLQSRMS